VFHLFKKVYLESDDVIDVNNDRLVISQTNGVSMLQDLDGVAHGRLIEYARSIDDLVGEGKKYANFLLFLNSLNQYTFTSDRKLIVYVDKENFLKIAITWIKVVLPSATVDDAYTMVSTYQFQTRMFGTSTYYNYSRSYKTTQIEDYISQQEFSQVFYQINVDSSVYNGFVNIVKSDLSLELLLASYLANGSCKEQLKAIALNKRQFGMQESFYECKSFIIENLLNPEVINLFSPTKTYTTSNLAEAVEDPAFDIWFAPSIWGVESIAIPHSDSLIYFNNISASQFEKFKAHLTIYWTLGLLSDPGENGVNWINHNKEVFTMCRKSELTDSDLETLIMKEIEGSSNVTEFLIFGSDDKIRYNIYLLSHIKQLYKENQISKLNAFVIQ
jgi:hypothetical protein